MTHNSTTFALRVLSAGVALTISTTASASAEVGGYANGGSYTVSQGVTEATLSGTVSPGRASFSGYANAATGVLKSSATSNFFDGNPGAINLSSRADSSIRGYVTFTSGFGTRAFLDYSFDGEISEIGLVRTPSTYALLSLFAGQSLYSVGLSPVGSSFGCFGECIKGYSTARTGTLEFIISENPMMTGGTLEAYSDQGHVVNFSNTGKLFLRTDEAWSSSKNFLTEATEIFASPVPEPSTSLLMFGGLAVVLIGYRKRRTG